MEKESQDTIDFYIKRKKGFQRIQTEDILFVKSDSVYLNIYLISNKKLIVRQSLYKLGEKLPKMFLKVHRSCIVNMEKITYLDGLDLHLEGSDEVVKVSKAHLKEVLSFWPIITT